MPASSEFIYIGADFDLWYEGAHLRAGDGSYLNDGTCTWALRATGTSTDLASGELTYTAESDGDYLGHIPASATAALVVNANYDVLLTFTRAGVTDRRTLTFKARNRGRA